MRKSVTFLLVLISLISMSTALTAQIDQNPPPEVVLSPQNNYSVEASYSSTQSSPPDEINTRNWLALTEGDSEIASDSGINAEFTITRGQNPSTDTDTINNIQLIVNNGTAQDVIEVPQTIYDAPNASLSLPSNVEVGDTATVSAQYTNTFDGPVTFNWTIGGENLGTKGQSISHTFDSSGSVEIKLQTEDQENYSSTTTEALQVASKPEDPDDGSDETDETGDPINIPPSTPDDNETSNETSQNRTDNRPDQVPAEKKVKANVSNGVAQVNIEKAEGTKNITVDVDPRGDAPVRNIKISSDSSGEVSVSVQDLGSNRPSSLPEPAAEEAVYNYQEINTSINDSDVDVAEIDFSVNQSWIEERNTTRDNVVMKRFDDGNWTSLETRYINTTDNQLNFEASSTGFSYYAVALQQETENQTGTDQTPEQPVTEKAGNQGIMYAVIVVVLLLAAAILYLKR